MGSGAGKSGKSYADVEPVCSQPQDVLVMCGPIVGTVTTDGTAHVLLEIDEDATVVCTASPTGGGSAVSASLGLRNAVPGVFQLRGLQANTEYSISFDPLSVVAKKGLEEVGCVVRTPPRGEDLKRLRVVAVSCDWPERLPGKEKNPWDAVADICRAGECDVMLHLGDQVYTWANSLATRAMQMVKFEASATTRVRQKIMDDAAAKLQEAYRNTWHWSSTAAALARSSHLMIWSDNDVTNDFSVLRKEDGSQEYAPAYLCSAMQVYRMYQRQLWDPACLSVPCSVADVEEWHFHQYGPFGIFLIDMRGNRVTSNGKLKDGLPPLLSERQKQAIEKAFAADGLACMLMCAEIPFVGDAPDSIREKAKTLPFLKDHWPHQIDELLWLLDLCFSWKKAVAGREVVLLSGDIHCGVESTITDSSTDQVIRNITTSPITNGVSDFHPDLEGKLSDRYSYTHSPCDTKRNFCVLDLTFDGGTARADAEIRCV